MMTDQLMPGMLYIIPDDIAGIYKATYCSFSFQQLLWLMELLLQYGHITQPKLTQSGMIDLVVNTQTKTGGFRFITLI